MKKFALIPALLLLPLLFACENRNRTTISQNITQQFNAGGAVLDLSIVGPDTWERVCVLGPYTDNAAAERVLGFKWDLAKNSSIREKDGTNLLVFVQQQAVVTFTEHPRNQGDFAEVAGKCFDRGQAKFDRQVEKSGWVRFIPK